MYHTIKEVESLLSPDVKIISMEKQNKWIVLNLSSGCSLKFKEW